MLHPSIKRLAPLCLALLLTGCSSPESLKKDPDPYEGLNRKIYSFNDFVVRNFGRPMVTAYQTSIPQGIRNSVQNFFENVGTIGDIANDILQLNPRLFLQHSVRLVLNTTLGMVGLVDVATPSGFKPVEQSFGLTMAGWGYESSAYLMLPFYGPSTVRDAVGRVPDFFLSPVNYVHPERDRYIVKGVEMMQTLAQSVPQYDTITGSAMDPYIAIRNAYLQRQRHLLEQIKLGGLEIDILKDPFIAISDDPTAVSAAASAADDHLSDIDLDEFDKESAEQQGA
jgi:phospholipid-binding lipoprotein MlaA